MPRIAIQPGGPDVDVPDATLGILQFDAETSRAPAHDLWKLTVLHEDRWSTVRWFNERDFGGMLGGPSPYSATVLGNNAVAFCTGVRDLLDAEPPRGPVVLLHQRDKECYGFLRDQLALEAQPIPLTARDVTEAWLPTERDARDEILLRFPRRILEDGGSVRARAVNWFSVAPGSAWRVVLELRVGTKRLPVLIRTADVQEQRVIACSLLLESEHSQHAALLENILSYAALGWPDVAVLDLEQGGTTDAAGITRRLRLQHSRAVRVFADVADELDFDDWPLRGARRLVVPGDQSGSLLDTPGLKPWLSRGGVALGVVASDRMLLAGAENEAQWVARRWAVWYCNCPPARWLESLFTSRSVLQMLSALQVQQGPLVEALGIAEPPSTHKHAVAALLAARLRGGSAERTIAATAAVLDLDRLVGGRALSPRAKYKAKRWLRRSFHDARLADKLDIARVLSSGRLLDEALEDPNGVPALSAVEATRLREAACACLGHTHADFDRFADAINDDLVIDDLRRAGSLGAAELLTAWCQLRSAAPDHPLSKSCERVEAAALDRLANSPSLADELLESATGHDQSVEGLALVHWLGREPGSTWMIPAGSREFPPNAVRAVIHEVARARRAEQDARLDVPALGTAVLILGAVALAAVVLALFDAAGVEWVSINGSTGIAAASVFAAAVLLLVGARWLALPRLLSGHKQERDLALAQVTLLAAILLAGTALLLYVLKASDLKDAVIFGVVAGVLALVLLGLWRMRLAPRWTAELLAILSEPRGILQFVRERQTAEQEKSAGGPG